MKLTITVLFCYALTSGYIDVVGAQQCLDPSNPDFCVRADYNRDRLPPNPPLNVTMNLAVSVSILLIHHKYICEVSGLHTLFVISIIQGHKIDITYSGHK